MGRRWITASSRSAAGNIGVWVSGFFGSGKSHFLKVLSYLLRNDSHTHEGQTKQAVAFFEPKIKDAMLLGDIKRAVASHTDVILFNIDSKADTRSGREAILSVFLKVLNEMQGYCPDHPHIAHMERYLDEKGTLDDLSAGVSRGQWHWTGSQERDAYQFHRDEVITAWSTATGQSTRRGRKVDRWGRRQFCVVGGAFLHLGEGVPRQAGTRASPHLPGGRSRAVHRQRYAPDAQPANDHRGPRHDLPGPGLGRGHLAGRHRRRPRAR